MQTVRVLVIDDMRSMRTFVRQALQGMGVVDIKEAEDGKAAFALLQRGSFDLVISDIEMPRMDGVELLEQVRKDDALKHLPFILLTAVGQRAKVTEAMALGVCDYVLKPINPNILERRVNAVLARKDRESG